ncbi:phthiotriol/phenolphthiotriol dimycocerosates methyltransferase [Mycobacterium palustre]|uniref:SAM-dependent methyltransferase n=1 Tax=Mycobacterium palustre TaxID=153971 RepID=A0A1X1ZS44_9MYCO|nr:class I SAM-dependent methyltransferase [Mycobacterium palustre]ORW26183.1 SAM-dependent methyltransferase [Mycobacterium palustre]
MFNRYWYRLNSRFFSTDDTVFMNWGYEEDPPMALPLSESDEPHRYSIQLYHSVATQVDLTGKRVLEVSCGHGGGASYVMRTLGPASYTGLDLNPVGLDFCRRKHHLPGLDFVEGNAEDLPFPDQSFDAVINIEASHCYPRFPRFLEEVARVLRPGGHLLYADARRRRELAKWEAELHDAPMRLVAERVINEQVARGVERLYPVTLFKQARFQAMFGFAIWMTLYRRLLNDDVSYRIYCFARDEASHTEARGRISR